MNDTYASQIVTQLMKMSQHLASIDAALNKMTSADGLKVELGIHEKLSELGRRRP